MRRMLDGQGKVVAILELPEVSNILHGMDDVQSDPSFWGKRIMDS